MTPRSVILKTDTSDIIRYILAKYPDIAKKVNEENLLNIQIEKTQIDGWYDSEK